MKNVKTEPGITFNWNLILVQESKILVLSRKSNICLYMQKVEHNVLFG